MFSVIEMLNMKIEPPPVGIGRVHRFDNGKESSRQIIGSTERKRRKEERKIRLKEAIIDLVTIPQLIEKLGYPRTSVRTMINGLVEEGLIKKTTIKGVLHYRKVAKS